MPWHVPRKYYDSLHDHGVKSLDTRKDYLKMVHPGTDRFMVELCRNKHTNEGKRASRGEKDSVLDNELQLQSRKKIS